MSNVDYEYRGTIASSWDLLRGDTSSYPDRGFFRDVIKHSRSPEMRDYTLVQLSEMLQRAGYTAIHAVSGFSNQPATDKDEVFVILGKKNGD